MIERGFPGEGGRGRTGTNSNALAGAAKEVYRVVPDAALVEHSARGGCSALVSESQSGMAILVFGTVRKELTAKAAQELYGRVAQRKGRLVGC